MMVVLISSQHAVILVIDDEETLILKEVSRSKLLAKQNDPISKEKKINTTLINYVVLNRLSEDFGKRFVPQQELSAEQAFWLQTSHPNTDQFDISPVKIKAPRELPKVSLVNTSLKRLKYHLGKFDTVVKKRITPDAITKGECGFEHTKAVFLNEVQWDSVIGSIGTLRLAWDYCGCVLAEKIENNSTHTSSHSATVSVAKLLSENERLHKEIKHLKKIYKDQFDSIKKTRALSKEHCDSLIAQLNSKSMENADLKGQIQEKVFVTTTLQNELRRLKGKNVLDNATTITNATTIAPGMFKLELDPLAPRLLKNRDARIDYLKYTQEQADILWGIELLVYVRDTCPTAKKPSRKLVVVTPMNKVKKVRFSEPLTSSSNIHKQVKSSKTPYSNTLVLPSTGLKSCTSASRSQPIGNKNNDKISQTPSSKMKNKVEVQRRRANLSSNKQNRVKDPICDANVKHTMLNVNSKLICVKCKQCMFDANHDVCFLDFVNDENMRSKSKSAKQSKQHNIWKPTGKVFTEVGYKWKPTGKLFTLVGNSCPLTRFTSANLVPHKENTSHSVETQKPEIKVVQIVLWYLDSGWSKHMIGNRSQLMNFVSKFLGTVRFGNDQIAKIMGYGDYQLGNVWKLEGGLNSLQGRDEKKRLDHLKQDQKMLVIKIFSERKKVFREIKKCKKIRAKRLPRSVYYQKLQRLRAGYGTVGYLISTSTKARNPLINPKAEDNNQEKLYLLHMDLYGPIHVESINGKNTSCKTPYELMHDKKPDLSFLYVFGSLYYPTNDSEDSGKLNAKADIVLVPNPIPQQPCNPPTINDWDRLFQSMFDEYFNPPPSVVSPVQVAATPRAVDLADSPVSTSIDQDAPS
ncbi:hypothetical protein Tco_1203998 [Tanacetum coccineum]